MNGICCNFCPPPRSRDLLLLSLVALSKKQFVTGRRNAGSPYPAAVLKVFVRIDLLEEEIA